MFFKIVVKETMYLMFVWCRGIQGKGFFFTIGVIISNSRMKNNLCRLLRQEIAIKVSCNVSGVSIIILGSSFILYEDRKNQKMCLIIIF